MTRQNTGNHSDPLADVVDEFTRCLGRMSHSRAGWDYSLPPAQRAAEDREEREALARARALWAENPALHDALRVAFNDANPLASMREIEAQPPAHKAGIDF